MRSFPFRKATEKGMAEIHTSSGSHDSMPNLSGSHVNGQEPTINYTSTQIPLEQEATTANQEKSEVQVHPDDHPEYPHGLKLATITIAVALSVFLVALVLSPEISLVNALDSAK
jgi:hypothetical protein